VQWNPHLSGIFHFFFNFLIVLLLAPLFVFFTSLLSFVFCDSHTRVQDGGNSSFLREKKRRTIKYLIVVKGHTHTHTHIHAHTHTGVQDGGGGGRQLFSQKRYIVPLFVICVVNTLGHDLSESLFFFCGREVRGSWRTLASSY
jgi:hypothetical protein